MNYKKWINWHNYSAAFFLPLAVLFIVTGALYMLDVHGETITQEIPFTGGVELLEDSDKLLAAVKEALPQDQRHLLNLELGRMRNNFIWGRTSGTHVVAGPNREGTKIELSINRPSLYELLVLAHKGKVGKIFIGLSILFAVTLLFSYISGLVMALKRQGRATIITLICGLIVTIAALWLSV